MYSALVEMPFSISDNVNNVGDDFLSNITLSLGEVSCRLKRGSELEVNATLFVYADFFGKKVDAVITDDAITLTLPQIDGYICVALKKA